MDIKDVVVTIGANPAGFEAGMSTVVQSSQAAATAVTGNLGQIASSTASSLGVSTQAIAQYLTGMQALGAGFPETIEGATAAAAAIERNNAALLAGAAAEAQAVLALRARLAASRDAAAATMANADANNFATASEQRHVASTIAEMDAFNASIIAKINDTRASTESAAATGLAAKASQANANAKRVEAAETAAATISSRTYYETGVALSEILSGNYTRLNRTVAALGNSTGFLQAAMSNWTGVLAGVGAIGLLITILGKGESEVTAFTAALVNTNQYVGQTTDQLLAMTDRVGASTGHFNDARAAVLALAASGKVAGDDLELVAQGVITFANNTGKSIDEAVQAFDELAKSPVEASLKLNDTYHYLTASIFQQIDALHRQGDELGAVSLAQKAFADANIERAPEIVAQTGYIQAAWNGVKESIQGAWNEMLKWGQATGPQQMLQELQLRARGVTAELQQMNETNQQGTQYYKNTLGELDKIFDQIKEITNSDEYRASKAAEAAAKEKAASDAENAASIQAQHNIDGIIDRYAKAETAADKIAKAQAQIIAQFKAGANLPQGMTVDLNSNTLSGPKWDEIVTNINKAAGAYKGLQKEIDAYNAGQKEAVAASNQAEKLFDDIIGKADPAAAAWQKQADVMGRLVEADDKLLDADQKMIDNATTTQQRLDAETKYTNDLAAAKERELNAGNFLTSQTREQIAVMGDFQTILDKINNEYKTEETNEGLTVDQKRIATEVQKAQTEALKAWQKQEGPNAQLSAEQIQQLTDEATAHVAAMKAIEAHKQAMQEWQNIMASGLDSVGKTLGDFATGAIKGWKALGQSLVGDAKQFISQIIAEFLKLEVFNGIINSLFGSNLPTGIGGGILGALGGGGGIMGAVGGMTSGGGVVSGLFGGSSGGSGAISNALNGANGSNGIVGWLFGDTASTTLAGNVAAGGIDLTAGGTAGDTLGFFTGQNGIGGIGSSVGGDAPGFFGSGGSLGTALGFLGAGYAGINEYKNAGGGAMGLLGGATYGIGTLALGGAVSGAFGIGAAGAAAGGGLAGAAAGEGAAVSSIGASAAIPIIGWIAAAAMLVNMVSGGKLFGTGANKFVGAQQTETVGDNGASVSALGIYQGQHALFGGSYYKNKNIPVSQDATDAANQFYAALLAGTKGYAESLNAQFTGIVGGSFTQNFDKKGNPTTTTSSVLGQTYTGETQQQFGERLQADSYLKVLDSMGIGASAFVAGLQSDADKLFAGVQDLASTVSQINAGINAGFKLMGVQGDQTIANVTKFVMSFNAAGETLQATYARLAQAQAQYNQLVGQFAPAKTYVDDFEASLASIRDTMNQNIAQANALAQAAGAAGANTQDLANIAQSAANQMAAAVVQLESSAQQLAFSLGLSNEGSLDQINQEIQTLEGNSGSATSSLNSFGNSIKQVSQKATDAMNLLLGNLSPLNDQQKLQVALQGLRAGTATADQVLTIGRSLYASSDAYNQLFAQVQQYAGQSGGNGSGHGGGGGSGGSQLSSSDQARLNALLKEQAVLQAAATTQQYQTLAQQIEEIANAKGETYQQVISDMGINIKDLEKGLGIKSDEDFDAYMNKLGQQTDSAGDNTQSIVTAITNLQAALLAALGAGQVVGLPTGGSVTTKPGAPPTYTAPPGTGTQYPGTGGTTVPPGAGSPVGPVGPLPTPSSYTVPRYSIPSSARGVSATATTPMTANTSAPASPVHNNHAIIDYDKLGDAIVRANARYANATKRRGQ